MIFTQVVSTTTPPPPTSTTPSRGTPLLGGQKGAAPLRAPIHQRCPPSPLENGMRRTKMKEEQEFEYTLPAGNCFFLFLFFLYNSLSLNLQHSTTKMLTNKIIYTMVTFTVHINIILFTHTCLPPQLNIHPIFDSNN